MERFRAFARPDGQVVHRLTLPAVLIALALGALGGCGGDSGESTTAKSSPEESTTTKSIPEPGSNVPPGGKTIVAEVFEKPQRGVPADVGQWMFEIGVVPGDDLAFTVGKAVAPPGNTNFHLKNPQAVGHNLTVEEVGAGKEETPVIREGSAWMRVSLFTGKRYVFYCSVPGHREAGMEGTIKVSPGLEAKDLKPF